MNSKAPTPPPELDESRFDCPLDVVAILTHGKPCPGQMIAPNPQEIVDALHEFATVIVRCSYDDPKILAGHREGLLAAALKLIERQRAALTSIADKATKYRDQAELRERAAWSHIAGIAMEGLE